MSSLISPKSPEAYVLGETPSVPYGKLNMTEVFCRLVSQAEPVFKYMPCFQPLGKWLNTPLSISQDRLTDPKAVSLPDCVSEKKKVWLLEEECEQSSSISRRKAIFLNDTGQLLYLAGSFSLVAVGFEGHEVAISVEISIYDRDKLAELERKTAKTGDPWGRRLLTFVHKLKHELEQFIAQRELRLVSLRKVYEAVSRSADRIKV